MSSDDHPTSPQDRDRPDAPDRAAEPAEPAEPTFASPTPAGVLPAGGLDDVRLPATGDGPPGRPGHGPAASAPATSGGPAPGDVGRRRVLLATGAVVALALVAAGVALGVDAARSRAWEPVSADVPEALEVNSVQLVLGSCVAELPADGAVERVTVVPCDDPHEAQVVGRTDASPDAVWPGDQDAGARARASCGPPLLGAQGRREADGLRFVVWAPSEASWEAGDRTSLCLASSDPAETGSLLR
ncbi:septum formation family protein [Isoptericola cucumis]|uniref:Septum formation-related domain-containing protein n=2 Tax=Isoptericola cucumis TaxID=1776856 RepID=A0ABQ2B4L3_9MICO|nr:septum formation family protein [Isoptericola cucumis]GGI04916.1 hypothetical protein GCM10007368_03550 [Isoptericola cucumis]